MAQSLRTKAKNVGLLRCVVIDDAYAPIEITDITAEALGEFAVALQDDDAKIEQLKVEFSLETFDALVQADIDGLAQNADRLQRLWTLSSRSEWAWLNLSLFSSYREKIGGLLDELDGLEGVIKDLRWEVERHHSLPERFDVAAYQIIFLDFFLKGELLSDQSIERASKLGALISKSRENGTLPTYPLLFLMSSRAGASPHQQDFKDKTGLRADFFCFLEKAQFQTRFDDILDSRLSCYREDQDLAQLLDEYWIAALRAARSLREAIALLEPSELALLHEAELGVEEEAMPDYLSWLVSEFVAAKILGDDGVRKLTSRVSPLFSQRAFPGTVPPTSRLAEMYVRSMMRFDVADAYVETRSQMVNLGDLFAKVSKADGHLAEFLLVVDQSCDLMRPATKETVLCLKSKPVPLNDVAIAFYRNREFGDKHDVDVVPFEVNGVGQYFLSRWDMNNPQTPLLKDLERRRKGYTRIARFKTVHALARQAQLTQKVSRIGEPVAPPNAVAYRAKLIFNGKAEGFRKEFDATKQPWASAVIVQGRHMPFTSQSVKEGAGAGKAKDKETTSRLSLTSHFSEWLKGKLDAAQVSDTVAAGNLGTFSARLAENALQRLKINYPKGQAQTEAAEGGVCKATLGKLTVTIAFGKVIPDQAKADAVVLLLRPYGVSEPEGA